MLLISGGITIGERLTLEQNISPEKDSKTLSFEVPIFDNQIITWQDALSPSRTVQESSTTASSLSDSPRPKPKHKYAFIVIDDIKLNQKAPLRLLTKFKDKHPEFDCDFYPYEQFTLLVHAFLETTIFAQYSQLLLAIDSTTEGEDWDGLKFLEWMTKPNQAKLLAKSQLIWYSDRMSENAESDHLVATTKCIVHDTKAECLFFKNVHNLFTNMMQKTAEEFPSYSEPLHEFSHEGTGAGYSTPFATATSITLSNETKPLSLSFPSPTGMFESV